MNVRLISITQPVILDGDNGGGPATAEQLIAYTARVSNPGNQHNNETADRLLGYLIKHKHFSPFEMVSMCVEIQTSRAITQQITRHRSFSFQEFSQRYAEVVDMEPVQLRKQAEKNRQSSTEEFNPELFFTIDNGSVKDFASELITTHLEVSQRLYKELIKADVAKECARMVLPLTTQSTIYMNGTIRSWIHYLEQRLDPHTQLEHRQVAEGVERIFIERFPNISRAIWPDRQLS